MSNKTRMLKIVTFEDSEITGNLTSIETINRTDQAMFWDYHINNEGIHNVWLIKEKIFNTIQRELSDIGLKCEVLGKFTLKEKKETK